MVRARAPLDDAETLAEGEERPGERRGVRSPRNVRPVDLLAERAGDLEDRPVVGLLLAQGEELRDEDVVDRRDEQALGVDLEPGGAGEVLVVDLAARRTEDQVDEIVAFPRLEKPVLGWALSPHPLGDQSVEGQVGVAPAEVEIDVVIGRRSPTRPDRQAAAEHELDLGLA